jgi:AmmeMemoRadiSam system protein A
MYTLTGEEKLTLLTEARETIAARFSERFSERPTGRREAAGRRTPSGALSEPCGAFVTLRKEGNLRGCIGFVAASKPLLETVREVAVAAAFEDPRFPPLGEEELPKLTIEISVLSPLKRISDVGEIIVGTHGIMMKRGFRSGLLLPQVATEQGWDRETFLTHACYKAGLPGDAWKSPDTTIEIFTALVFHEAGEAWS